jgi:Ca2+-transporting ATPase
LAAKAGERPEKLRVAYPRIFEVPFTSERKRMTTVHNTPDGQLLYCMKGAIETVLPRCEAAYLQGASMTLNEDMIRRIRDVGERMAADGLRVLVFAYKTMAKGSQVLDESNSESNLMFLGVMGITDPPREEVKEAVQKCGEAGIKVVMITGDHKGTAEAVAQELVELKEKGSHRHRA